jgi:hypothetical protein
LPAIAATAAATEWGKARGALVRCATTHVVSGMHCTQFDVLMVSPEGRLLRPNYEKRHAYTNSCDCPKVKGVVHCNFINVVSSKLIFTERSTTGLLSHVIVAN